MVHRPGASWAIQAEEGKADRVLLELERRGIAFDLVQRLDSLSNLLSRDVLLVWRDEDVEDLELYVPGVIKAEGGIDLVYNLLPPITPDQLLALGLQRIPLRVKQQLGGMRLRQQLRAPVRADLFQELPFGTSGMTLGNPVPQGEAGEGAIEEILNMIGAREAWRYNQGDGAVIAIMDSGVDGSVVPEYNRIGGFTDQPGGNPWADREGHGSMCARIALAVAPKAQIMSLKPDTDPRGVLSASAIYIMLDHLIGWVMETGKRVVLNMSWGVSTPNMAFFPGNVLARDIAIEADRRNMGLLCHAIGNSRHVSGDTVISAYTMATLAQTLGVGALGRDLRPQFYTSRGPGALFPWQPAVAAPTFGVLPWGNGFRDFGPQGGATSSATPQVAGVLALLDTQYPDLDARTLRAAIRAGARNDILGIPGLYHPLTGSGLLRADRALEIGPRARQHPSYVLEGAWQW